MFGNLVTVPLKKKKKFIVAQFLDAHKSNTHHDNKTIILWITLHVKQ